MTRPLKIRKWGGSYGVTLPRQVLDDLGVTEGDLLYPVRTTNGVELTRFDPAFADIMEDAEDYMRRHHNAMRELAK